MIRLRPNSQGSCAKEPNAEGQGRKNKCISSEQFRLGDKSACTAVCLTALQP